ncbi:N-terminal phage integrase SAM-like domain-containing protein [Streptomyces abyssomicinicus]|uniref:N-terminal phage integrase SAM-like domain-containing protein n=1 Tax=Streptomyces abyssomicinicus TaxID=574929 RepID=UPI00124FBCC2|nr:N-terminal phage integrase SAM-like domain-containing protein [Streptomyces abyssomicinicus]
MAKIWKVDCACPKAKKSICRHKPWKVRYRDPGGRVGKQLEVSFKLKNQAEDFAGKVEREKAVGTYIDPKQSGRLMEDVWNEWLSIGNREPSTLASYRGVYRKHIEPVFGGRTIGSITSQDIAEWRAGQEAAGLAPATVHRHYVVLKAAFI